MERTAISGLPDEKLGERVFQNTLALLGGRGVSLLLSVASSILLVRYLGSERLGQYGALYAYLALYGWLATFGLEPILAREAAQQRAQAGSILFTGVVVGAAFALAGTLCALILAPYFGYRGQLHLLLVFAAADLIVLTPMRLPGIIFQVDMRQWYGVGIGLFRQILWLLALALLALGKASFFWVILGRTLCGVVEAAVVLVVSCRPGFLARPWGFLPGQARAFLRYGFPIAVSSLAVGIYHRIDQVMLHNMTTDQLLGRYVAAVNVTELFSALPVALMSSLFPILSQMVSQEDRFRHYLGLSFRSLMAVVFGLCALLTPVAEPLVRMLYGQEFASASRLLIVLIWSEVPVFFGVVMTHALIARNLQRYLPLSTAVGAGINIALNFLFIPRWGALGSAWATVISYTFAGIFLFLIFRSTRSYAWQGLRIALPAFALALVITGALTFLPWHFLLKLGIALALYGTGAWLTQVVRRSEMERVWQLIRSSFPYVRAEIS